MKLLQRFLQTKHLLWILGIGLILRLFSLNQSLWLDEAIGAIAVHDYSYTGIVSDFIKGDTHPPLYYLTLKFWTSIFGYSEIAMRMLSVVFGVSTVYIVYRIAAYVTAKKKWFAPLVALLFAVAPLHIYYSQEVRMYAMNTFLVSLLVLWYLKNDFKKYAVTLLLLGMTDYLPLLVLPVLCLYAFFEKRDLKWWKTFFISHVPLVLFLMLWFPTFIIQSVGSREALILFPGWGALIGKAGIKELAFVWIKFLIGRISFDQTLLYGLIILTMTLFVSFPFVKSLMDWRKVKFFWIWFLLPISIAFVGALFVPGFSYFRMIIVLPAFYILLAYGLSAIGSRWLITLILFAQLGLAIIYLGQPVHHREDWRGAVEYIAENNKADDIVLQAFPEPFAGYRWYGKSVSVPAFGATGTLGSTPDEIKEKTNSILLDVHGVYYFRYLEEATDPGGAIKHSLTENGFKNINERAFRGVGIVEYWRRE